MPIETLEKPLAYQCEQRPRPLVEHWWEHQLTDLAGKPTGPLHVVKGNSWLANMASQMRTRLSNTNTNATNTAGSTVAMVNGETPTRGWSLQSFALPRGQGIGGRGILVASGGAAPEDTTDFNLDGTISDGTGVGALLFQDDVMHPLVTIAGGFRIFHEKLFLNQSGASITITNLGISVHSNISPSSALFLLSRDVITIVVPDVSGVIIKFREDWTI